MSREDLVLLSFVEIPKVLRKFTLNYTIYLLAPSNTYYLFV